MTVMVKTLIASCAIVNPRRMSRADAVLHPPPLPSRPSAPSLGAPVVCVTQREPQLAFLLPKSIKNAPLSREKGPSS